MTYKKIKNVKKEVCTCEQKIAYNLAFAHAGLFAKEYNRLPMQFQKSELISAAIRKMIEWYKNGYDYTEGKYDIDSIFCALQAGLENYIKNGCKVLWSYEEIGAAFPAHYLKKA